MEDSIVWNVIANYFKTNDHFITKHHLDSYNDFAQKMIPRVITTLNPIIKYSFDEVKKEKEKHRIEVYVGGIDGTKIYFDHPTITHMDKTQAMFPNDARLNDMTYAMNLICDVDIVYYNGGEKGKTVTFPKIVIGKIPIMLHSNMCILSGKKSNVLKELGECPYDQGGYFIVDGKEKVIVSQERNITNQIFITRSKKHEYFYEAFIRCKSEEESVFPKRINFFVHSDRVAGGKRKNTISVELPHIKKPLPLFLLFRSLGVESDKEILQSIIGYDMDTDEAKLMMDFLHNSIIDGNYCYNKAQALDILKEYTEYGTARNVEYVLQNNLFPNIDFNFRRFDREYVPDSKDTFPYIMNSSKVMFLGHIVNKLVRVCIGMDAPTDIDNYMYKRVAISGFLVGDIFVDYYNQFRNNLRDSIDRAYEYGRFESLSTISNVVTETNKTTIFDSSIITSGMLTSLKGSWGITNLKSGIVQDLNRISYMSFISHLRLVSSPLDPSIKIRTPHQLNTSQYGIMCPVESPDGQSVGLIKNFSIMCHITFNTKSEPIIRGLYKYFPILFLENILKGSSLASNMVKIMVNNTWIGVIADEFASKLVHFIRLLRRNALINIFTSVSWKIFERTINILTEDRRCTRPLLVVDQIHDHMKKGKDTRSQTVRLFTESSKPILKSLENGSLHNWYLLAKGQTLEDEEFDMYSNKFIDPREALSKKKARVGGVESVGGKEKEKEKEKEYVKADLSVAEMTALIQKLEENAAPIEFLDVEETNTSLIAMFPIDLERSMEDGNISRYTHCEIHPSLMFSVYTSTIPLANHNHAPRNMFSGAQGKQAIGLYATNFNNRIDTMSYVLHYPQQRLVQTRYSNLLKTSELPNGENLIVAICPFQGYNQEDSIIFNKDSVDRGMFNITAYKSYRSNEDMNSKTGDQILFRNPNELRKQGKKIEITKYADYTKIDANGFPKINSYIKEGDVIIGKVKMQDGSQIVKQGPPSSSLHEKKTWTNSKVEQLLKNHDDDAIEYVSVVEVADKTIKGHIDKVYIKQNYVSGLRDVKVRMRKFKTPELGDKAASTHGQKGVCGLLIASADMPFTKDGIVPDIIINPHAIPSRMTVGHLLECVLAKVAVSDGIFVDATPFDHTNMEYFYERLEEHGLERFGNEIMYDGMSGRQMDTHIFIGPTHYHRLKHMVSDKISYRSTGKRTGLTLQPTKGRSNEGGLKIGEMETNAVVSHGMAGFIKESFMERSDKASFWVSHETGDILAINSKEGKYFGEKEFSEVFMPFSFKLLSQELKGMCINPRFKVHERGHFLNQEIDGPTFDDFMPMHDDEDGDGDEDGDED